MLLWTIQTNKQAIASRNYISLLQNEDVVDISDISFSKTSLKIVTDCEFILNFRNFVSAWWLVIYYTDLDFSAMAWCFLQLRRLFIVVWSDWNIYMYIIDTHTCVYNPSNPGEKQPIHHQHHQQTVHSDKAHFCWIYGTPYLNQDKFVPHMLPLWLDTLVTSRMVKNTDNCSPLANC